MTGRPSQSVAFLAEDDVESREEQVQDAEEDRRPEAEHEGHRFRRQDLCRFGTTVRSAKISRKAPREMKGRNALNGRVQLIAMTCGMLRSSTSSGALTSVRPALRSFFALRMRSAGRYVSGTRVIRRTYSTAAQLRATKKKKKQIKRSVQSQPAPPLAQTPVFLRAYMMSVYHVHLQLVFWLTKPEMSGPETGPTARQKKKEYRGRQ